MGFINGTGNLFVDVILTDEGNISNTPYALILQAAQNGATVIVRRRDTDMEHFYYLSDICNIEGENYVSFNSGAGSLMIDCDGFVSYD